METAKETAVRFPIEKVLFIFTVGFFIVISFPFDLFSAFSDGLPPLDFVDWFVLPVPAIESYVKNNFQPFVNLRYLGGANFPTGLIQIILCSLPVGVIIFFTYGLYEKSNHIISYIPNCLYYKATGKKQKQQEDLLRQRKINSAIFNEWISTKDVKRYYEFIVSMKEISVGLLYGSETMLFVIAISGFFLHTEKYWGGWLLLSILIWLFFVFIYKSYKRAFPTLYNGIIASFIEYQKSKCPSTLEDFMTKERER
jgi:hypothetical protein